MSFLPYSGSSFGGWFGAFGASAAVHGGVVAGLLGVYGDLLVRPDDSQDRTEFVVTLEQLDSDTLAGIIERQGVAGADDQDSETTEPVETTEAEELAPVAAEPESVEPTEEEIIEEAEPEDSPEELTPEMPEATTAETLTAESVESLSGTEALAPEPIQPVTESIAPIAADDPDLSPIMSETIAAVTATGNAQALAPVSAPTQPVAPPNIAAETVQTVTASAPAVTALNNRPAAPATAPRPTTPAPPPSAQDLAIGDLIRRIRAAALDDPCLIALPRRDGTEGVGLALIAARDGAMEQFAQDVMTPEDADIRQTRTLVDPRQCPAITYIRQNADYPATRMGLRIDQREINSGDRLTGVLRGGSGRYVTLLLIDDNGVVQDLQRFLSFSGNLARFDVPMTRSGPNRDTSQIILALATQRPANALKTRAGQLAQDVFANLPGELASDAFIAVATIDVR